ncbi:hypothetical protein BLNAU_2001 [Blattamonas nauphoetae]|uniref:Uncharacterized protein n=1 Tax=Blattamonas nauphoetae TaxID=2049346 RepID=A0ABQ9YGX7_9EUKA|nr:hypothetical protein BLNAU_2001 [Blattamonas nauphoetae]
MQEESIRQSAPSHAHLSCTSDSELMFVSEGTSFLDFDLNLDLTFADESAIYSSLVALVTKQHSFDKPLQDRASQFLRSLGSKVKNTEIARKYMTNLVPPSDGTYSGFVRSILTLTSSSHSTVVASSLAFLNSILSNSRTEEHYHLVEAELVSNVLETVQPHLLPISGHEVLVKSLIETIDDFLLLSSSDRSYSTSAPINPFRHRENLFWKVVLPSSQFVTFLIVPG